MNVLGYCKIQGSLRSCQFLINSLFLQIFIRLPFSAVAFNCPFGSILTSTRLSGFCFPQFLIVAICQNTLQYTQAEKYSQILCGLPLITYLQFFQMADDTQFPTFIPPVQWCFPYYYPNMVTQFPPQILSDIENIRTYSYFPIWNYNAEGFEFQEKSTQKIDEAQAFSQTSAEYKSAQQQKKKRVQGPRFRPTKNNESNICNQAFSFMTNESKSKTTLQKLYKNKKKADIFYQYTGLLSSTRKKYMSKGTILKLCSITESQPQLIQQIKQKSLAILSFEQFENGVQFLLVYFLKHKVISSILTSQKIAAEMRKDHIFKVRQILNYIQQNMEGKKKIQSSADKGFAVKLEC